MPPDQRAAPLPLLQMQGLLFLQRWVYRVTVELRLSGYGYRRMAHYHTGRAATRHCCPCNRLMWARIPHLTSSIHTLQRANPTRDSAPLDARAPKARSGRRKLVCIPRAAATAAGIASNPSAARSSLHVHRSQGAAKPLQQDLERCREGHERFSRGVGRCIGRMQCGVQFGGARHAHASGMRLLRMLTMLASMTETGALVDSPEVDGTQGESRRRARAKTCCSSRPRQPSGGRRKCQTNRHNNCNL